MIEVPTFTMARSKMSVTVNGLHIILREVPDSIARFCQPLFFQRLHDVFDIAYSGSSLRFRAGGRNFVLTTAHQYRYSGETFDADDACIVFRDGEAWKGMTANLAWRVTSDDPYDRMPTDVMLLLYDRLREGRNVDHLFVDFDFFAARSLAEVDRDRVKLIFGIGWPAQASDMDVRYDEDYQVVGVDIVNRWTKLFFSPKTYDLSPPLEGRIAVATDKKYHPDNIGRPSGFSGSPVMFLWQDDAKDLQIGFAGMITQGTPEGSFHLYPGEQIRSLVRHAVDNKTPRTITPRTIMPPGS